MRVLLVVVALGGCFLKPERHPHDSDAHPSGDGTIADGITSDGNRTPNRMFVTSGAFALGGTLGAGAYMKAEFFCNNAAMHATPPVPGQYLPWLSYDGFGAADALRAKGARAWVRLDDLPIGDTVDDLCDGMLMNTPSRDENNNAINPASGVHVMTGTTRLGGSDGGGASCGTANIQTGVPTDMDFNWTENGPNSCLTTTLRLYCFGVDRDGLLP